MDFLTFIDWNNMLTWQNDKIVFIFSSFLRRKYNVFFISQRLLHKICTFSCNTSDLLQKCQPQIANLLLARKMMKTRSATSGIRRKSEVSLPKFCNIILLYDGNQIITP